MHTFSYFSDTLVLFVAAVRCTLLNLCAVRVDQLLALVEPSAAANACRAAVVAYIGSTVKKSLGAATIAMGSFAARVYLPDQELALSCFLCRGQETTW